MRGTGTTESGECKVVCAYPGCSRPPRSRAGNAGGKPPIYCDLLNENTGKYAHTPVTARREEQRQSRQQGANGRATTVAAEQGGVNREGVSRSPTVARERAGNLLDRFQVEATRLAETIAAAIAELATAADPDLVRAELNEAHRRVERAEFDAAEQVKDAYRERDQATAAVFQLMKDRDEAVQVRDQAIDDLEGVERERDEAIAAAEQAGTTAMVAVDEAKRDAGVEIERVREQAAADVARIRAEVAGQVSAANRQRDEAMVSATRADAIAQRAADEAERHRTELADLRREHKKELADLRADNKGLLADQATQLRQMYEAEISRLSNQLMVTTGTPDHSTAGERR